MHPFFYIRAGASRGGLLALAIAAAGCERSSTSPAKVTDALAPKFSVSHEQNATNQPTATIAGIVTDDVGVVRVTYRVDGGAEQEVSITPGISVAFTATMPTPAAVNAVEFAAYDAAGNRAAELMQVMYDTEVPTLGVTHLKEGGSFYSFLRLEGVATDSRSGIRRVTYSVNGGAEVQITGGGSSSGYAFKGDAYGLPLGPNAFVVYAYDRAGNRGELRATMTRKE